MSEWVRKERGREREREKKKDVCEHVRVRESVFMRKKRERDGGADASPFNQMFRNPDSS